MKTRNIYDIDYFIGHVYKLAAYGFLFAAIFIYIVNKPLRELYKIQKDFSHLVKNQNKLLSKRIKEINEYNKKLINDLNYARNIQYSLLPDKSKIIPPLKFRSNFISSEELSGDYYNYYKIDETHCIFFISDVSGHGVPAAMMTVFVNQCIKSAIEKSRCDLKPSKILDFVYEEFNAENFEPEVYILLFICIYDIKQKKVHYSSAGLNTEPIFISSTGKCKKLNISGFAICKMLDIYKPVYKDYEIVVHSKDKLFMYTDGLTELKNNKGEIFTEEKVFSIIRQFSLRGIDYIFKRVENNVGQFLETSGKVKDDITFLMVEF